MKYFRQFMFVPAMALCAAMLTFSACGDDSTEVGGPPAISVQTAAVSRAGIALPVSVANADYIHYAALLKAVDATVDPTPVETDYKTVKVADLTNGTLLIPVADLKGLGTYCIYTYVSSSMAKTDPSMTTVAFAEDQFEEMLKFEVKNLSIYSLDVKVDMTAICDKYIVTVNPQSVAIEESFKEGFKDMGMQSIYPTESQLDAPQLYKVFSASATVPESQLYKNSPYDSDQCEGLILPRFVNDDPFQTPIKYVVTAYGIDKFGNESVYVGEPFTLPEAAYGSTPEVEIIPSTTYTKISAQFKASPEYTKIVYGSLPAVQQAAAGVPALTLDFWNDENKTAAIDFLKTQPLAYSPIPNGKMVLDNIREMSIVGKPGNYLVVFACGVTADGKLGPISYQLEMLKLPDLTGAATITSMKIKPSGFELKLFWDLVYSPTTTAIRFLCMTKADFTTLFDGTDAKKKELEWIMCTNESTDGYGYWQQFDAQELRQMNYVYSPDVHWYETEYVVYAAARDGAGKWGKIYKAPNQTTGVKPIPEEDLDKPFDYKLGTGVVTIASFSEETTTPAEDNPYGEPYPAGYTMTFKLTKGANTREVYTMTVMNNDQLGIKSIADVTLAKVTAALNKRVTQGNTMALAKQAFGEDIVAVEMEAISAWGANLVIIVSMDTARNYKIIGALTPGSEPILF